MRRAKRCSTFVRTYSPGSALVGLILLAVRRSLLRSPPYSSGSNQDMGSKKEDTHTYYHYAVKTPWTSMDSLSLIRWGRRRSFLPLQHPSDAPRCTQRGVFESVEPSFWQRLAAPFTMYVYPEYETRYCAS